MDYLKFSKKRRTKADEILEGTNLFTKLKTLGDARLVGSYTLDLMAKPDIDFVIRVKNDSDINTALKEIQRVIKKIPKIVLKKIVDRRDIGLKGTSIHLYYEDKEPWEIDILVTTKNFEEYEKLKKMVNKYLTKRKKEIIIKLKYYFYKKDKKIKNIPYCIYKSVLEGKVKNLEELYHYAEKE